MSVQIIQSEPLKALSVEEQQLLSGGVSVSLDPQGGPNGLEGQRWKLRPVADGAYVIENVRLTREQGTPMVLDYRK
jgi:hypothetical protein